MPDRPTPLDDREWLAARWSMPNDSVLAIELDRPERLNALSFRMLHELRRLIDFAATQPRLRVVTLRGAGVHAFCSGDDLYGMDPGPGDSSPAVHHPLLMAIRDLQKPVVALVCGWALGHGFELASACDLRICADNIEVGDHRVTRAIGLNGGTSWFVPRIVGRGRALDLLMTGRHLDAQEALAWGWANRVYPLDEFDTRAAEYVDELAQLPTIASGAFKAAVDYSAEHSLRDSLAQELVFSERNRGTEDAEEGRRSWHEKRPSTFKGR